MNDFSNKLKEVLALYEKTGSLEETIKMVNLNPNQIDKLRETFAFLDKIAESNKSLREAKENGVTRDAWLTEKVVETAEKKGLTPNQIDMMVGKIAEVSDEELKSRMEKEQNGK